MLGNVIGVFVLLNAGVAGGYGCLSLPGHFQQRPLMVCAFAAKSEALPFPLIFKMEWQPDEKHFKYCGSKWRGKRIFQLVIVALFKHRCPLECIDIAQTGGAEHMVWLRLAGVAMGPVFITVIGQ